jgi:hypothetical protein
MGKRRYLRGMSETRFCKHCRFYLEILGDDGLPAGHACLVDYTPARRIAADIFESDEACEDFAWRDAI